MTKKQATRKYIPERGDIISLEFDPSAGKEIASTRPALVITPKYFNDATGLALVAPITTKGNPNNLDIRLNNLGTQGVVVMVQIRTLDWEDRNAKFIERASKDVIERALAIGGAFFKQ